MRAHNNSIYFSKNKVFSKANSPAERRSFCLRVRFSNGSAIVPAYRFERSFELCNKATDEMLVLRTLKAQKNNKWLLRQTDYDDAPLLNPTKLEIKRMRKDAFLQQKENEPKKVGIRAAIWDRVIKCN